MYRTVCARMALPCPEQRQLSRSQKDERERMEPVRAGLERRERFGLAPGPGSSGRGPPPLSGVPPMSDTPTRFDFRKRVAYDAEAKRGFHHHARELLKLAEAL